MRNVYALAQSTRSGGKNMLSDKQIEEYFDKHNVSHAGREYIQLTRQSEPSRLVGENANDNVSTSYPSYKMGHSIQAESTTGELAFSIECEYDINVMEYWDQPQPISVDRTYKNGTVRAGSYIPDYLILTNKGPAIIQVKLDESLKELHKNNPEDWHKDGDHYHYRPATKAFKKFGLNHQIVNASKINSIRTANRKLLLSSRQAPDTPSIELRNNIQKALSKNSWLNLFELGKKIGIEDLTPILKLIDAGDLNFSLDTELLAYPESTQIALTQEMIDVCREVTNRSKPTLPEAVANKHIDLMIAPTKLQAERAINIIARIKSGENSRSIRRWKQKISEGEKIGLTPFASVLPKTHLQGNRSFRLNEKCVAFIEKFIKDNLSTTKRLLPTKAYALYKNQAKKDHPELKPVSRQTFRKYIDFHDQVSIARGRGGRRAANAATPPSPIGFREIKPILPFELCSMDHYLLDQECIVLTSNGSTYTQRPWITALVDVASGAVLAVWISLRNPSARSCAMAIRQCVRNHGRLPSRIIVDHGAEFLAVYFYSLLAHYGIALSLRPTSHPRYGSEVERFFGAYRSQWLNFRPGNYVSYNESRAVSSSHSPKKDDLLTIEDTIKELNAYIEWRNATIIGVRHNTPIEILQSSIRQFSCLGRLVEENEAFVIQTAVDERSYTIDSSRGIHIDGLRYWHPSLSFLAARRRPAEVRLEPEDPYRIYARVKDEWVICLSGGETQFRAKDRVSQLAESIRILDSRTLRDKAKEDAESILIDVLLENRNQESCLTKPDKKDLPQHNPTNESVHSIFDEVAHSLPKPLTTKKWRNTP